MAENVVLEQTETFTVESRASKLVSVTEMLAAIDNLRRRVTELETNRDNAERARERRLERIIARAAAHSSELGAVPDDQRV